MAKESLPFVKTNGLKIYARFRRQLADTHNLIMNLLTRIGEPNQKRPSSMGAFIIFKRAIEIEGLLNNLSSVEPEVRSNEQYQCAHYPEMETKDRFTGLQPAVLQKQAQRDLNQHQAESNSGEPQTGKNGAFHSSGLHRRPHVCGGKEQQQISAPIMGPKPTEILHIVVAGKAKELAQSRASQQIG
jgi:hypothetical protein